MTGWLAQTLIGTTLAMLAVLALRGVVARLWGARVAYALWLLPALRLILPPLPGWTALWVPVFRIQPDVNVGIVDPATAARFAEFDLKAVEAAHAAPHAVLSAPPPAAWTPDWPLMLLMLWILGAALWFGWQMLRYRHFVGAALAQSELLSERGGIEVRVSPRVDGPLAAGILRRRIFLPADFVQRYTSDERRLVLLHEGAHHDRHDLAANFVAIALVALHWWNPVAHWAYRAFRTDQELACDATVLAGASGAARHDYGRAVLKSVFTRTPAPMCALNHKTQLKQRIGMMKNRSFGPMRLAMGSLFASSVIGGGLLLTAAGYVTPVAAVAPVAPVAATSQVTAISPAAPAAPVSPPSAVRPSKRAAPAARPDGSRAAPIGLAYADIRSDGSVARAEAVANRAEAEADRAEAAAELSDAEVEAKAAAAFAVSEHVAEDMVSKMDIDGMVRDSMNRARDRMIAKCEAKGAKVDRNADLGEIAMCGQNINALVRVSLQSARASIQQSRDLSDRQRAKALSALDEAIGEIAKDPDLGGRR